ncbi:hypothetical protein ACHAWT_008857 [Skeletonema menzelii]
MFSTGGAAAGCVILTGSTAVIFCILVATLTIVTFCVAAVAFTIVTFCVGEEDACWLNFCVVGGGASIVSSTSDGSSFTSPPILEK